LDAVGWLSRLLPRLKFERLRDLLARSLMKQHSSKVVSYHLLPIAVSKKIADQLEVPGCWNAEALRAK
jgi:hypothetical protein